MTQLIAHRGISAIAPENTMDAFTLAWAYDCDGIELDIQISKDQQIIVCHDENLKRVAQLDMNIADTDWDTLRNIDVGSHKDAKYGGERMPLLSQVIKLMPTNKILQLEIKANIKNLQAIIEFIPKIRKDIDLYVISFNFDTLATLRQHFPKLKLLWIMEDCADLSAAIQQAKNIQLQGFSLHYELLKDSKNIQAIQSEQFLLSAWTVNDLAAYQYLSAQNIDMIVGDNPYEFLSD